LRRTLIDQLNLHYLHAHQIATRAEQAAVRAAGVRWRDYDRFMQKYVKRIGDERLTKVPADTARGSSGAIMGNVASGDCARVGRISSSGPRPRPQRNYLGNPASNGHRARCKSSSSAAHEISQE
jgi:hypothetical protein